MSQTEISMEQIPQIEFRINLSLTELISGLKNLDKTEKEFILENLLAALSPEYIESIEEARQDYKEGRVLPHDEIFQ